MTITAVENRIADPSMNFSMAGTLFRNLETHPGDVFYRPPILSKNQEVKLSRREIVRQARHVERFSEHVRGAIDHKADTVIGATLRVHPQPDFDLLGIEDPEARKKFIQQAKRWFNNWAYDSRLLCDAEGHYNFAGMMWLAYRNVEGPDGECAGVIHYEEDRRTRYSTRWATFVTVVDPDRVATPSDKTGLDNIFQGKRLDENGRMISMFIAKKHPSEGWSGASDEYVEVPRETNWGRPMCFHWFVKTRGGQQRGITNLVTILAPSTALQAFDTVYLKSAALNAELATYIRTRSSPEVIADQLAPARSITDQWDFFANKVDYYGKKKFRIGGGAQALPVFAPDDEVMMTAVNRAIDDPTPFRMGVMRSFASATGVPVSSVSQNYAEANYSSERASKLDSWLGVARNRTLFTGHAATLVYSAVIEEAVAEGWIEMDPSWPPFQENRAAYTACAWTGPGMGWIDPQKEAAAYKTLLDLRVTSRTRIAAERGEDIIEILDELQTEQQEAEDRDLVLEPLQPGQEDPTAAGAGGSEEQSAAQKSKKKKGAGGAAGRDGDGDGVADEKQ
jgi:lambda family phage portal protein